MRSQTLARIAAVTLVAVAATHALVIAGVIPFTYVGGGRYPDLASARIGETVTCVATLGFAWIAAARGRWVGRPHDGALRIWLWIMAAVFALNTVGNLAAATATEKIVFAPVTALLAAIATYLALHTRSRVER